METLITLATAPILVCAFYIYIRDKYEKEPIMLLIIGVTLGCFISIPIIYAEKYLTQLNPFVTYELRSLYKSFVVAGFTEETFKFLILYFLVYKNKNFNERFDGIVYAVFISLGFSLVENILFVINPYLGGVRTGISRALFSVPAHMIYGISMGYYFALIKYEYGHKLKNVLLAFIYPIFLHGTYDCILAINSNINLILFSIFLCIMWRISFKKIKKHIEMSPFKTGKQVK